MAEMLTLLDVLPRHERVDVGNDQYIHVFGISGGDIGKILARYPNAFQMIADAGSQPTAMDPGLLGALLAASQRRSNGEWGESLLGDDNAERVARGWPVADQVEMLQAMGRCTFPKGVGPFLESLVSMSSGTVAAMDVVVQVASRVPGMVSPPTQKPSVQPAIQPSGN